MAIPQEKILKICDNILSYIFKKNALFHLNQGLFRINYYGNFSNFDKKYGYLSQSHKIILDSHQYTKYQNAVFNPKLAMYDRAEPILKTYVTFLELTTPGKFITVYNEIYIPITTHETGFGRDFEQNTKNSPLFLYLKRLT